MRFYILNYWFTLEEIVYTNIDYEILIIKYYKKLPEMNVFTYKLKLLNLNNYETETDVSLAKYNS